MPETETQHDDELHYYMCDKCGSIADISNEPHSESDAWACADCGGTALWHFTDKDRAVQYGRDVQEKRHSAMMARLDAAIARADNKS
jgi:DNA-directed RNA polymerase subunit RPC12/RpoP